MKMKEPRRMSTLFIGMQIWHLQLTVTAHRWLTRRKDVNVGPIDI
jgi:hypothetical protein